MPAAARRATLVPVVNRAVLAAVLVAFAAQQLLTPVLAPLSRRLDLTEWQLGLVITVAAAALTVASPLWGRAIDRWGARTVLLAGLSLSTLGLAGFAAVASAGLDSQTPAVTLAGLLATRSLLFGAGIAALPVCALAMAAAGSHSEAERTKATGLVGAAQGISLVLGPAAGGLLAAGSLLTPVFAAPAVMLALTLWLTRADLGPAHRPAPEQTTARLRPTDPRVLPHLLVGFALFLSLGLMQVNIGFLLADRLGLSDQDTAAAVGGALFATGLVLAAVQAVAIPRLGWGATRLLRVGAPIAALAYAVLLPADQMWSIVTAMVLLAIGLGLCMPGYAAAPTLAVPAHQHGAVAGMVNATNGLTFIVGPLLGGALYAQSPATPIAVSLALCLAATAAVWLRRPPRTPAPTISP